MYTKYKQAARVNNLSTAQFSAEYGIPGIPVIITEAMTNWTAMSLWTFEYFLDNYGNVEVTVQRGHDASDTSRLKLADYFNYMIDTQDNDPYYLSNWQFEFDIPGLMDHYTPPEYFYSWHLRLPPQIRPCWRWLYIGGVNSGTKMHRDVLMTSAWNGVISGQKRWLFYPPEQVKHVYEGKVDAFNPDFENYPLFADAEPIECIQKPGDIVYTPSGWWHQVVNEQPGISLTENFFNETNSHDVMTYIAQSPDPIRKKLQLPENVDLEKLILQYIPEMGKVGK